MAKKYTGSLTLEWFNKNRSIITQKGEQKRESDIPAPRINWINKDEALFYEISEEEGKGLTPYWVDRNDIRVKESRPLVFQKAFKAVPDGEGFKVEESDVDDPGIGNILIKGDNLLALNTLKKMFDQKPDDEKVKCIFIDPPYNTGSAFEQYDDSLAHSEWLTMIRDRLKVLRDLLSQDGSIWITIDDNEVHYLKLLCDEIFGRDNYKATITWQRKYSVSNNFKGIASICDYFLVYSKTELFNNNLLPRTAESKSRYVNPDNDPRGPWKAVDYLNQVTPDKRPNLCYDIINPNTGLIIKNDKKAWKYSPEVHKKHVLENRIWWGIDGKNSVPSLKLFLSEVRDGMTPHNWWAHTEVGHTDEAKKEMIILFGAQNVFETPKPERLIERIFQIATKDNDLVLDAFIGSGTTPAVAQKMKRRWIGLEIGDHCDTHCIPRLKKVSSGEDQGGISVNQNWNGGGSFKYYHLGESIIAVDKDGYGDFNWSLGRDFIETSLLATYDFILDESFGLPGSTVEQPPKVGFYNVNNYTMAGVVSLSSPDEGLGALDNDYITELIAAIRKYKSPQSITIFTNRGVEMAWESKPEDVEIIKVPHAIFAELER